MKKTKLLSLLTLLVITSKFNNFVYSQSIDNVLCNKIIEMSDVLRKKILLEKQAAINFENNQNDLFLYSPNYVEQPNPYGIQYSNNKLYVNVLLSYSDAINYFNNNVYFDFGQGLQIASWELASFTSNNQTYTGYRPYINCQLPVGFSGDVKFIFNSQSTQYSNTTNATCALGQQFTIVRSFNKIFKASLIKASCANSGTYNFPLNLNISGGVPPYTINWGNVSTLPSTIPTTVYSRTINTSNTSGIAKVPVYISGSVSTDYALNIPVSITDATGANLIKQVTINSTRGNLGVSPLITNQPCSGKNGFINLRAFGGALPRALFWSNGTNGANLGVPSGTYNCIITDANGCTFTSPDMTILNNKVLGITATSTSSTASGNNINGQINISVTNGTAPYKYFISPATGPVSNTPVLNNPIVGKSSGNYIVKAEDAAGCNVSTNVTVGYNPNGMIIYNGGNSQSKLEKIDIQAYPNPSIYGIYNVDIKNGVLKNISVIDVTGKTIYSRNNLEETSSFEIDINEQPSGIYFLKAIKNDSSVEVIKLMK